MRSRNAITIHLPLLALLIVSAGCDRTKPAAPAGDAATLFTGDVDQQRHNATMRHLDRKASTCDAIVLAVRGSAASEEGIVEALFIVQQVLKGTEFLEPHIQRRDFDRLGGEQLCLRVRYLEPWLASRPLTMPDGPVILFLDGPELGSEALTLCDNETPNDGAVYATQEVVENVIARLDRLR